MSIYMDMPNDMEVEEVIIDRILQNTGALLEVCVVKHGKQYEAALFFDRKYKPGPPLPRPLESPSGQATHWMGVRPKVGLTQEEADAVCAPHRDGRIRYLKHQAGTILHGSAILVGSMVGAIL